MKKRISLARVVLFLVACLALVGLSIPATSLITPASATGEERSQKAKSVTALDEAKAPAGVSEDAIAKSRDSYGRLPIRFELNRGQTNKKVKFLSRGQGFGLFLTSTGAVLSLSKTSTRGVTPGAEREENSNELVRRERAALSMSFRGANPSPRITGVDRLPGKINYFVGNDPRKWRRDLQTYSKVRYRGLYRGIDLIYYGNQEQLEYDLVVAPGANPNRIKMSFAGAEKLTIDDKGDLVLSTSAGNVIQKKPVAYQEVDGKRREILVAYRLKAETMSFKVGDYDKGRPLIIDPVVAYSTFLGGSSYETGVGIAVDAQGNAYLTGETVSTDFPIVGGFQPVGGDAQENTLDAYVVKLNPAGTAIVYSTYLGGNDSELISGITVDSQGNAFVTGTTGSHNFPVTAGVFQQTKDGLEDVFVTKLNPSGSALLYSTFIGGDNSDIPFGIAVRPDGRVHVVGRTDSTQFNSIPLNRNGNPAYKSIDGAANWSASSAGLAGSSVRCFGFDSSNSNIIYAGTNIGVFKSNNAGASWSLTGTGNPAPAPQNVNAIVTDPSNPNILYYGASDFGVFKSTDGGGTYTRKHSGSVFAIAIDPLTPTTLYAGMVPGMFKSTDGGENWFAIQNGFVNPPVPPVVWALVIDPSNPAIVYAGTREGMYKSSNGGALWTPINNGSITGSTQIFALVIDPLNPSTLYAGGQGPSFGVHKTTDGGATWTNTTNGVPVNWFFKLAISPTTPSILYLATLTGIFKSSSSGADWIQSNTGLANTAANAVAVDPNNPAIVYAGTSVSNDAFALRLSASGSTLEQLFSFGGLATDEARGVALDASGSAYLVGTTSSPGFPVVNAFQPTKGASADAFVAKLNDTGTGFVYATFLGGSSSDEGRAIAVRENSAYVTGTTFSADFPTLNAFQPLQNPTISEAFVTKFNATGLALDFSSYHGGGLTENGLDIELDSDGAIYLTGLTSSQDFPTVNPTQPTRGGGNDAFLTKIDPSGAARVYSSYLGGFNRDQGNAIAVDSVGSIYVIGNTSSVDFPTVNPLQPSLRYLDAFVTKIAFPGVRFTAAQFAVGEGGSRVLVDVSRNSDSSVAATVDYKTSDTSSLTNCDVVTGVASSRCDYATSVGRLSFAAGETSKTISIPIVDDAFAEGNESFTITLGNPGGAPLGTPATATVTINDNETVNGPNPIDQTAFFVRQHYVDFLGREPDPPGAAGWEAVINTCPAGSTDCDRIHVSSAFFRSPEFQGRGYFVYRFYPVAFGRKPDYVEFIPDLAKVSGFLSEAQLEAAKLAFITDFMSRPSFVTKFNGLNNTEYVDTLLTTADITHPARNFWIAALGDGSRTRAEVLREISDSNEVSSKYFNQAFVVMQYFGYLRRQPDAFYLDWIEVLDSTGDFRGMVSGFMNSSEYRLRFGP